MIKLSEDFGVLQDPSDDMYGLFHIPCRNTEDNWGGYKDGVCVWTRPRLIRAQITEGCITCSIMPPIEIINKFFFIVHSLK